MLADLPSSEEEEDFDVIVIGAGISGIAAGYYLQSRCPGHRFTILEGRERLGGTWDLFRYPGIRSDSDMYTLGYAFRPWDSKDAIADGPAILRYLNATAEEFGIVRKIQFRQRVTRMSWSSAQARWTVSVRDFQSGKERILRCRFLWSCAGYYRYESGYTPDFEGLEDFEGQVVHPQFWPEQLDYGNKRVVVIGSGATAVTLVPALAEKAAKVTMLQRSPTYVMSAPQVDPIAEKLRSHLPDSLRFSMVRWKNILVTMGFYYGSRRFPEFFKRRLINHAEDELRGRAELGKHFRPQYNPWDQRLCLVPDGDLFRAIASGRAQVVTDSIERFVAEGVRLSSGETLAADIVVTATGLVMELLSGVEFLIDGKPFDLHSTMAYRAMMLGNVPNFAFTTGYTNASWTLKVDIVCRYVCRVLNHMRRKGYRLATPRLAPNAPEAPLLAFNSGYIKRALNKLPRGGAKHPWRVWENYLLDRVSLAVARMEDGVLEFQ